MTSVTHTRTSPSRFLSCGVAAFVLGCGTAPSAGVPPAPREPAQFTYGPFSETYAIVSHTRQEQEVGGQITTVESAMRWRMTASTDPTGGEAGLTMTIDSAPTVTGTGADFVQGDLARAAGTTFVGTLTAEGRVVGLHGGDTTNAFLGQLAQSAERFFPRVPAGGAAPGQRWTDTLSTSTVSGGLEIHLELVSRSEAGGWVDRDGLRALEVATVTDYTLTGGGSQMGTEIDLDGTGSRHSIAYLAADGRFLGSTSADTSNMTATVAAMGMMIPIIQVRHDSVSVVH